jgi:hypothetical protein
MGDWRSGSAAALHADGHWFESDIAHYKYFKKMNTYINHGKISYSKCSKT